MTKKFLYGNFYERSYNLSIAADSASWSYNITSSVSTCSISSSCISSSCISSSSITSSCISSSNPATINTTGCIVCNCAWLIYNISCRSYTICSSNSRSLNIVWCSNWATCICLITSCARNNVWLCCGISSSVSNVSDSSNRSYSCSSTLNVLSLSSNIFFSFRIVNNLSFNW